MNTPRKFFSITIWAIALTTILASCGDGGRNIGSKLITADCVLADPMISTPTGEAQMDSTSVPDYNQIIENKFIAVSDQPLSTFGIDVDGASYSTARNYINSGSLPPSRIVRIEEMINYFHYDYVQPTNADPFSLTTEMSSCPWNEKHRLISIALKGKEIKTENLPPANLVFLIDVSGSMAGEGRLPLVKSSLALLTEQLREQDKVGIVVYAGAAGMVLPSTHGDNKREILNALDRLEAGGSTAGADGIQLAYKVALENYIEGGNNRVILATDGDFNVGISSEDGLEKLIEKKKDEGVFLTVLGYGMGNYQDQKMQTLADKGNGNHAYIDNELEAKKVLVNEFGGTLFTIAKDVKIQVEFNPEKVKGFRLIGYENRMLAAKDFENDKKDAGELGSGHCVTALYEIIPAGSDENVDGSPKLKYQKPSNDFEAASVGSDELMTVKFRYKKPDEDQSKLITKSLMDTNTQLPNTTDNFRFSASVAEFTLLIRDSEYKGKANFEQVLSLASGSLGSDKEGYRKEFMEVVKKAENIMKASLSANR